MANQLVRGGETKRRLSRVESLLVSTGERRVGGVVGSLVTREKNRRWPTTQQHMVVRKSYGLLCGVMLAQAEWPSLCVCGLFEKEANDTVFTGWTGIKLGTNRFTSKHATSTNKKHEQIHEIAAVVNVSGLA